LLSFSSLFTDFSLFKITKQHSQLILLLEFQTETGYSTMWDLRFQVENEVEK